MSLDSMQACSATDKECTEARDWSQLPLPALTNLMLQAGQSARHGKHSCALVCSSWAEAVDAAAAELKDVDVYKCASTDSLQDWLIKHGQQLEKLRLHSVRGLSVLLCSQLQRLSLYSCGFDLTADSSAFCSSISTATGLTSLHINKCRLMVDMEDLDDKFGISQPDTHLLLLALTSLTALQELSVCGAAVFCNSQPASDYNDPPAHLPLNITVLQPLQHLTQLHLQLQTRGCIGGEWPRGVERMLQHIGTMTDLQDLRLGCNTWERDYYDLDVAPLTSLTKLRSLGLRGVDLKNVGPPGSAAEAGANVAALLAWVAKLQGLSSLQLRTVAGLVPYHQEHQEFWPPATAYNALTASSALQHIDLLFADISQKAAWRHIFPRDDWSPDATLKGKFTNITSLRFGPHLDGFTAPAQRKPVGYFLDAVAGSCSNLQELQACDFEDMGPLQHHTSLTRLTLTMKYAEDCDVDVSSLVKLTQLKSLQLLGMTSRCLRDVLRGLTAHITLTHLSFRGVAESDSAHDYRRMRSALDSMGLADQFVYPSTRQFVNADNTFGPYTIMSKAPAGSPSDLPSRLRAILDQVAQLEAADRE